MKRYSWHSICLLYFFAEYYVMNVYKLACIVCLQKNDRDIVEKKAIVVKN